ncbi:hypothetical protein [Burkholderia ubonensis]|uniref:hypothetical protein n=1 Tax=Burkholderia ubonensis TaxID=101571 RepID=UPI0018E11AE8|nr:hypothetical protein [Burkholderia ubonensis]
MRGLPPASRKRTLPGRAVMNGHEILAKLAGHSPAAMQRYASSCLRRYCEVKGLSHPAVDALLAHLDSIATSRDLAEWERKGAWLDLNGRGDPIPADITFALSEAERSAFAELVESVVEVGIVDLYGAKTDLPLRFLDKAMRILERNGIPLPAWIESSV